jgi:dTMP kinase
MIIAFSGCDGSGKSTQVRRIRQSLQEQGWDVEVLDKWDILNPQKLPECRFLKPDLDDLRVCIAEMEGPSRAMFLFWSIAITLTKDDLHRDDKIYLLDGYWMKHAASEIIYGCPSDLIDSMVRSLPRADLTFYFDITPEESMRRKPEFTPYECGRILDYTPDDFIRHQTKLRNHMLNWVDQYGWYKISSFQEQDAITKQVLHLIEQKLKERRK